MNLCLGCIDVFAGVLFRYFVVAASCTTYAACLTKDAYVTATVITVSDPLLIKYVLMKASSKNSYDDRYIRARWREIAALLAPFW